MIRKYVLPLIAAAGLLFAVGTVVRGNQPVPAAAPVAEPAKAPFESYVAGAGLIEASTENIAVGTPVSGIVTGIHVKVGDRVETGAPLFEIDDRDLVAELAVRETNLRSAEANLAKLREMPRREDLPPAEAQLRETEASLADAKNQLKLAESVRDPRAISREDLARRRFAVGVAEARLARASADLEKLRAGAWQPDLEIAAAAVAAARSQVEQTRTEIDRRVVRALEPGQILQVKTRVGEFAQAGMLATPLMMLGNESTLHVRVDVDENDAWRFEPGAQAVAFVRGNPALQTKLRFERTEPYVIPKVSLTGQSSERVDTRVLQVIYSLEDGRLPVYVGQQMDVFISAPSLESAGHAALVARPASEEPRS
jgi:HlyD family secretion protein